MPGFIQLWFLAQAIWKLGFSKNPSYKDLQEDFVNTGRAFEADPGRFMRFMARRMFFGVATILVGIAFVLLVFDTMSNNERMRKYLAEPKLTQEQMELRYDRANELQWGYKEWQQMKKDMEERRQRSQLIDDITKLPICTSNTPKNVDCKPDHPPAESDQLFNEIEGSNDN